MHLIVCVLEVLLIVNRLVHLQNMCVLHRHICKMMRENPSMLLFLLGSDQAMEENMFQRVLARPGQFRRIVAVLDFLHVMMWVLCGLWQLSR